jgi:hypothetical protein
MPAKKQKRILLKSRTQNSIDKKKIRKGIPSSSQKVINKILRDAGFEPSGKKI